MKSVFLSTPLMGRQLKTGRKRHSHEEGTSTSRLSLRGRRGHLPASACVRLSLMINLKAGSQVRQYFLEHAFQLLRFAGNILATATAGWLTPAAEINLGIRNTRPQNPAFFSLEVIAFFSSSSSFYVRECHAVKIRSSCCLSVQSSSKDSRKQRKRKLS